MNIKTIGQLAGAAVLTIGLAGCMDITSEVEILSETTGRVTTTSVMGADIYAMMTSGMAAAEEGSTEGFCNEAGATLTENADGSATCVVTIEGSFDELKEGDNGGAVYEVVSPGVVKVSFSTEGMESELGVDGETDEQSLEMMKAFFADRAITIRVSGKRIVETNMTSVDSSSAEIVIPFLGLLEGTLDLPETLYATVDTN